MSTLDLSIGDIFDPTLEQIISKFPDLSKNLLLPILLTKLKLKNGTTFLLSLYPHDKNLSQVLNSIDKDN